MIPNKITLKYPKDYFKIDEVKKEKNKFDYKDAWVITEDKNNFLLNLDSNLFEKKYSKKIVRGMI